jgi:hypothetical protein
MPSAPHRHRISSIRLFEASPCRPTPEGLSPSQTQHRVQNFKHVHGTQQKTRLSLRIQATSTIESDGLRSGRNRGKPDVNQPLAVALTDSSLDL